MPIDDSWICQGFFIQTKHLCVLIHTRINGEVVTVKLYLALQFQGGVSFVDFFVICVSLCHTVMSGSSSLVVTCWEKADLLALL